MALTVVITVDKTGNSPSYTFRPYSGNILNGVITIDLATQASERQIDLTLVAGNGSPTLLFASPPITWYDSGTPTDPPQEFEITPGDTVTAIADKDDSPGTFHFKVNVMANGNLIQSPDPTIINKDQ